MFQFLWFAENEISLNGVVTSFIFPVVFVNRDFSKLLGYLFSFVGCRLKIL